MAKATSKTTDKEAPQVDAPVETPTPEAPQVDAPVENDNSAEIELGEITQLDITSNHDLDIKKEFLTPQDEAFSKEIEDYVADKKAGSGGVSVCINEFLIALFPSKELALLQTSSKQLKGLLAVLVAEGKFAITGNKHLELGKPFHYEQKVQRLAGNYDLESVVLMAE